MTRPMFVEKTYRPKFARQNFIKAEKIARQNSYFQALGGVTPHTPPRSYAPVHDHFNNNRNLMQFSGSEFHNKLLAMSGIFKAKKLVSKGR